MKIARDKKGNIKDRISKGRAITAMLKDILLNRKTTRKYKLGLYNSIVKSTLINGAEK